MDSSKTLRILTLKKLSHEPKFETGNSRRISWNPYTPLKSVYQQKPIMEILLCRSNTFHFLKVFYLSQHTNNNQPQLNRLKIQLWATHKIMLHINTWGGYKMVISRAPARNYGVKHRSSTQKRAKARQMTLNAESIAATKYKSLDNRSR